jgi:hypothetical protein
MSSALKKRRRKKKKEHYVNNYKWLLTDTWPHPQLRSLCVYSSEKNFEQIVEAMKHAIGSTKFRIFLTLRYLVIRIMEPCA